MKVPIEILITISSLVYGLPTVPLKEGEKVDPTKITMEINKDRREFAEKHDISNMNELIWDPELLRLANFSSSHHSTKYRMMIMAGNHKAVEQDIESQKLLDGQIVESNYSDFTYRITNLFMEHLLPEQESIACDRHQAEFTTHTIACAFGPIGSALIGVNPAAQLGEPGSNCSGLRSNFEGLCRLAPPTTTTTISTTSTIMTSRSTTTRTTTTTSSGPPTEIPSTLRPLARTTPGILSVPPIVINETNMVLVSESRRKFFIGFLNLAILILVL